MTTWKRFLGIPVRSKIALAASAMSGVTSEGLSTTALPARSAMIVSPRGIEKGKFQGEMMPTTPRGT